MLSEKSILKSNRESDIQAIVGSPTNTERKPLEVKKDGPYPEWPVEGLDVWTAMAVPFDQDPNYERCMGVDFAPVRFAFSSDPDNPLAASEHAKIEAVAEYLQANPDCVVIVEGNCDERGSNEYNLSLGEFRASSIRDSLVRLGIDAQRIQTRSYGEEKPAMIGENEAAWSKNRRGEFAVFRKK